MTNTTTVAKVDDFYATAKQLEEKGVKGIGMKTETAKVQTFPYKGTLNKTDFPDFIKLCKMSAKSLKGYLCRKMKEIYPETTFIGDGYIYCKGEIPVLLTAHMDTVHSKLIKDFYEDVQVDTKGNITHTISSPQGIGGDDRCGVYEILQVLEDGYRPYILFCEDEEVGGIGSNKFCKTNYIKELTGMKFLLELDRANADDLVFYNNDNKDWIEWVEDETNWKKSWGSFSDICHLSPECGIASVNLSCGYYKAHTVYEYVVIEEMLEAIKIVEHLLEASEKVEPFEYIEKKYSWGSNRYNYSRNYYDDDDWDEYYWENYGYNYNRYSTKTKAKSYQLEITFLEFDEDGKEYEVEDIIEGTTEADCWAEFFKTHQFTCYADVLDYYVIPFM